MRAGACTIQQALTAEAAAILKHSLNLARRRGHAQVTPLHVAATLLNSSSSASSVLRRACIMSRPHHPTSLPLQCRALELCFNVALNRLPTSPPPSSSSVLHTHPSLSNALIAALKRAQAHQRRGCIESQSSLSLQSQQQSNQPLLTIKVELEQLIISILDDPSVSRVMREAGFSSTSVKQNLEEDSAVGFGMAAFTKPHTDNGAVFIPTQFVKQMGKKDEEVKAILEVMTRKTQQHQRKRAGNAVVVGDNASMAEGVIDELLMRLGRGEVPEELREVQVIKLQLSYAHLKLMSRIDVEMKVSDLRRRVYPYLEKGVVIYAGDLRWAVGEEDRDDMALSRFSPAAYFISEVGSFLSELRSGINGAVGGRRPMVWVLAFSSYQTYMRCKLMNTSLESQWSLQAVVVPSGGLALSLHAPRNMDSVVPKLKQYQFHIMEHNDRAFNVEEEDEKLLCCTECIKSYEKDAATMEKPETKEAIPGSSKKPDKFYKENLFDLRRKWIRLCRSLHPRISQVQAPPQLISKVYPGWSNSFPSAKRNLSLEPSSISLSLHSIDIAKRVSPELSPKLTREPITTTLALCSPMLTDSATPTLSSKHLTKKLQENIPWQFEKIQLVIDALLNCRSREEKGNRVMIQGNDMIAKRRLARVLAESFGSTEGLLRIDLRKSPNGSIDRLCSSLEKGPKSVALMEGVECSDPGLMKLIKDGIRAGFLTDSCGREVGLGNLLFIFSSESAETLQVEDDSDKVLSMRMWEEDEHPLLSVENKDDWNPTRIKKKLKTAGRDAFDLNVPFTSETMDDSLNDFTHEFSKVHFPAMAVLNFDANASTKDQIAEGISARLRRAFEKTLARNGEEGRLVVDPDLAEKLAAASAFFLEAEFDRWVRDVFQIRLLTVKNGGQVRLALEGKNGILEGLGFLDTPLPKQLL